MIFGVVHIVIPFKPFYYIIQGYNYAIIFYLKI